jgi:hypothetical protein
LKEGSQLLNVAQQRGSGKLREDDMNKDRRNKLEKLRRQLDDIKGEIGSLKDGGQDAFVEELESAVASVEGAIGNICPAIERDDAGTAIDLAQMTFGAWLREEMRKGVYVSVADAAAAYEAAGYKWLKD